MGGGTTTAWTRADLDRFPDDGHRRELVDGQLLVSPLARRRHQDVVLRIARSLADWADDHGGIVYPGVNIDLAETTHLEPDVVWASDTDTTGSGFARTPELVVEVGSPSTHRYDRGIKLDRYLTSGAHEVWLVDLTLDEIAVHRSGGATATHGRGDAVTTPVLPGWRATVDDLLGPTPS